MSFSKQPTKPDFPALEEKIASFWEAGKIFEKSVEQREGGPSWHFYDGPPFISGMPHYGHIKDFIVKDAVPRYYAMKGYHTPRVWGWDCHGLPIENKVEKKLGLTSKLQVEEFGISQYIAECYDYTRSTSDEWPWYVRKMGRWTDYKHAYRTMDQNYMETVWWVFKTLKEKGLVYRGWRSSLYSTDSATPVSNFEIAMDNTYEDVEDKAITVKFKLQQDQKLTDFLARIGTGNLPTGAAEDLFMFSWTTTPWTIPSNYALAVNPAEDYVLVETPVDNSKFIARWISGDKPFDYTKAPRQSVETIILSLAGQEVAADSKLASQAGKAVSDLSQLTELEICLTKIGKEFFFDLDGELTPIDQKNYQELSKLATTPAIKKVRYSYPLGGENGVDELSKSADKRQHTAYIDEYQGELAGLNLIEIDFETPVHYISFKENLPDWFGEDLTYRTQQLNNLLSKAGNNLAAVIEAFKSAPEQVFDLNREKYYQYAVLANKLAESNLREFQVLASFKGKELEGLNYEQIYKFFPGGENDFKVYLSEGVTVEDGTGVLHLAPAFGEEDFNLGKEHGLSFTQCIDDAGKLLPQTEQFAGLYLRDAAMPIINDLKKLNRLYKAANFTHRLPFYRYANPLIYRAQESWFVNVQQLKPALHAANEDINWIPGHLKKGRFAKGIDTAPDWSVSRSRFWSTSMPVWVKSEGGKIIDNYSEEDTLIVGSRSELAKLSKNPVTQLNMMHLPSWQVLATDGAEVLERLKTLVSGLDASLTGIDSASKIVLLNPEIETEMFKTVIQEVAGAGGNPALAESIETVTIADLHSLPAELAKRFAGQNVIVFTPTTAASQLVSHFEGKNETEAYNSLERGKYSPGYYPLFLLGDRLLDLHRPVIDDVVLVDKASGQEYVRVPEVLDVWMDSGSMPYAQLHYPFENKLTFENNYPADFIVEYIAQTRAWFYVTHVLGVALTGKQAFKNVVTSGVIFGTDGRKMSKTYGNYPDPKLTLESYGAEAMRWYFLNSKLIVGEDINFDEKGLRDQLRLYILPLWNSFSFFTTYAQMHNWQPTAELVTNKTNPKIRTVFSVPGGERNDTYWHKVPLTPKHKLDIWIIAKLQQLTHEVRIELDQYQIPKATRMLEDFVAVLSKWYIRSSRARFASGDSEAFSTLYYVLVEFTKLTAPFTPFVAEEMYNELVHKQLPEQLESVHLCDYPEADIEFWEENALVLKKMQALQEIVSLGQKLRNQAALKVRQPLQDIEVRMVLDHARDKELENWMEEIIAEELNIKQVKEVLNLQEKEGYLLLKSSEADITVNLNTALTPQLLAEGYVRELTRQVQKLRKDAGLDIADSIKLEIIGEAQIITLLGEMQSEISGAVRASELKLSGSSQYKPADLEVVASLKLGEGVVYIRFERG